MKKVILAGNSVAAEILYGYLLSDDRYDVLATTVDDEFIENGSIKELDNIPLSQITNKFNTKDCCVIMAMGYKDLNFSRESMYLRLKEIGYQIETYIHPDAKIYTKNSLGEGCVVMPLTVIEPHVSIGANCVLGSNVTVAHHTNIGESCWVASGAVVAGKARIGHHTFLGVNSTIVDSVIIGDNCIIGAGALITKNAKNNSVYLARSGEEFRCSSQEYVNYFGI